MHVVGEHALGNALVSSRERAINGADDALQVRGVPIVGQAQRTAGSWIADLPASDRLEALAVAAEQLIALELAQLAPQPGVGSKMSRDDALAPPRGAPSAAARALSRRDVTERRHLCVGH